MSTHKYAHAISVLSRLGDALVEASTSLEDGDETHAAERLRIVHEALQAAESAPDWETLALVLEPYAARLGPPADADDSWPFNEHLDDLPDPEDEDAPPNLPFSFRKAN